MDDDFFDKNLLISLIDGLGYFSEDTLTYEKSKDTLGKLLQAVAQYAHRRKK